MKEEAEQLGSDRAVAISAVSIVAHVMVLFPTTVNLPLDLTQAKDGGALCFTCVYEETVLWRDIRGPGNYRNSNSRSSSQYGYVWFSWFSRVPSMNMAIIFKSNTADPTFTPEVNIYGYRFRSFEGVDYHTRYPRVAVVVGFACLDDL